VVSPRLLAKARRSLQLAQVATDRFFLVPGEWPVEMARKLIEALQPKRVVIRSGPRGETVYYLLPTSVAMRIVTGAGLTVEKAVATAGTRPVPALDAGLDADDAPEQCVVLDDGLLVGIFDTDLEVPDIQRGRSAGDPEPGTIVRLLAAEMERRVPLGQTAALLIFLADPDSGDPAGLPMALPPGSEVDVYMRTPRGFETVGKHEARLLVTAQEETLPVQFRLRATDLGRARIEILVFLEGSCLGRIVLTPEVIAGGQREAPVRFDSYLVSPVQAKPDLTLVIMEIGQGSDLKLLVRLGGPGMESETKTFGPIPVRLDPLRSFNDFFRDVQGLGGTSERARRNAIQQLESKGANLFEHLLPEDLRLLLWEIRERIHTLEIESAEPWIPWELCRLVGRKGNRIVEAGYLCEEFVMSRWILGMPKRRGPVLRRIGVIASEESGLRAAVEERRRLLSLNGDDLKVEPITPRFLDVMERLASGEYDGLHFAGHGNFRDPDPDRSRIVLDQGEELRPENLSGERANLGAPRPLVFLNACEAGRRGFSLTGMGGWAPRFLRAGAAAFLGPVWAVGDSAAGQFAEVFYKAILAGSSMAEAVWTARRQVRDDFPGEPAWLAYTLFADPLARVVTSKEDG
jgi:hypothetical protein